MNPPEIHIAAYWHDSRFRKKTGGLIRIFEMANYLVRAKYDVHLILPKIGNPSKQTQAAVTEIPFIDLPILRPISFHLILSIVLTVRLLINRKGKLYVRQMNSFLPLIIARLLEIQAYYEVPNDPFLAYSKLSGFKKGVFKIIERVCYRLAEKVVVLSKWSQKRLCQKAGIPNRKIIILPSGTDTSLFFPMDPADCRKKLKLDNNKTYVGFVGTLHEDQGLEYIVRAAPLLFNDHPELCFLIVGDGPAKAELKEMTGKMNIGNHFIFSGHVPYSIVPEYIGAMDVCLAPHKRDTNQASPVKLFDYMACGRPIIASDIDVVKEIVAGAKCALLVNPENPAELSKAIDLLLNNPEIRSSMGINSRQVISKYDRNYLFGKIFQPLLSLIKTDFDDSEILKR